MTTSSLLFGVAAVIVVAFFISQPLRQRTVNGRGSRSDSRRQQLMARKAAIYAAIREIDTDVETGKLELADHRALRKRYIAEAVEVLRALDEQEPQDAVSLAIEADISRLKEDRSVAPAVATLGDRFCPACGANVDSRDRFCSRCGAQLEE